VEVGPDLAEENFALLELQLVRAEFGRCFPSVQCERAAWDMLKADVRLWFVEVAFGHIAAHVFGNLAELLHLPTFRDFP
jgi:hypothetical protein